MQNNLVSAGTLACAMLWLGCGRPESTSVVANHTATGSADAAAESDRPILPGGTSPGPLEPDASAQVQAADPSPDDGLAGRWLLTLVLDAEASPLWMVEITRHDGSYRAKVIGAHGPPIPELRDFTDRDGAVRFQLAHGEESWPFEGRVVDGRLRGCIEVRERLTLAWLERTRLTSMRSVQATAPVSGWSAFEAAQQTEDANELVRQMLDFSEQHADSPMVFDALRIVLRMSRRAALPEEQLRSVTDRLQALSQNWGRRWSAHTVESIASDLATADGLANPAADTLAMQFAETSRQALPDDAAAGRKQAVEVAYAVALVRNGRAEEGKKLLDELLDRAPDEGELRFYAAGAAEQLQDFQGAIALLEPLWPHPIAARELERIWQIKYGSRDGLDERLDEIYLKRFPPLEVQPQAERTGSNNQVVVAELFTGSSCPPCVAPDAAFEALRRSFPSSDLVLLQYHLHVPGPDPMTNEDAIERAKYYAVPGTPWFLVNGRETGQSSGARQRSPAVFADYRAEIEKELGRKNDAKIKLEARQDAEQIAIEVSLSGVNPSEKLRLRLAIVEEMVRFHGRNGVRLHHAVVRNMPGGHAGIPVTDANLTHKENVNIAQLRENLNQQLHQFEQDISDETNAEFKFPSRPLELKKLRLIAFLQDDTDRQVVQAATLELGE